MKQGLTEGGGSHGSTGTPGQMSGGGSHMGESPKMIPIYYNGKPYLDKIRAFRVSKDGSVAACVLKNNEILIYRVNIPHFI